MVTSRLSPDHPRIPPLTREAQGVLAARGLVLTQNLPLELSKVLPFQGQRHPGESLQVCLAEAGKSTRQACIRARLPRSLPACGLGTQARGPEAVA